MVVGCVQRGEAGPQVGERVMHEPSVPDHDKAGLHALSRVGRNIVVECL
jgi:hypothetical protein